MSKMVAHVLEQESSIHPQNQTSGFSGNVQFPSYISALVTNSLN